MIQNWDKNNTLDKAKYVCVHMHGCKKMNLTLNWDRKKKGFDNISDGLLYKSRKNPTHTQMCQYVYKEVL